MKPIRYLPALLGVAVLGGTAAYFGISPHEAASPHAACAEDPADAGPITSYTCEMHPEVRTEQPGRCPECRMALVPVSESAETAECSDHASGCCNSPAPKLTLPAGHPPVPGYTVEPVEKNPNQHSGTP